MKWHIIKKQITTLLFLSILFGFAIINGIHTVPYLLDKKNPTIEEIEATINEKGLPYSNRNWIADEYKEAIQKKGIKLLNLREVMVESGMTYEEMFYVTDHHWTTKAAYTSFVAFVEQMNKWFNFGAFGAQVFSETDLIWTLKLQGNLEELIGNKVYDYVIVSLYPDSLTSNMLYFDK